MLNVRVFGGGESHCFMLEFLMVARNTLLYVRVFGGGENHCCMLEFLVVARIIAKC